MVNELALVPAVLLYSLVARTLLALSAARQIWRYPNDILLLPRRGR